MRRGRRKGGNKDKVFGCDLLEHLATTRQEIPLVLRSCSEFIEEYGVVDGIYRLSGVSSNTQKLRSEFDIEGNPDLNKEVYRQDIHCVSSLCKAYFRELPNPLLTYQLYDRFADAVAIQLEDERLVKIKDVLKELPRLHYKTLEYLMRHLVKMSTYAGETNMHARNLAIVWAPNLLRSKDIEASGFNGTAAFMEVRVQSIVVEFILTHVAQLFPDLGEEPGLSLERRKSLPSPSALSGHEDMFFKALPFQYPGNMSPGDGPPPMRPYHAIIDGTDKRKGSLKGRKWRSIFNLGGRLQDPRKKSKYTTKEKEKTSLRPAKSMDSLSSGPYTVEDSRNSPTIGISPLANTPGTNEGGPPSSGAVASTYAVTYRRTGGASVSMVSGGSGTQGTYKSLDTGATASADRSPATSHGAASKAERRAGMHISGPFCVTVPLHITSGLALGVLHGRTEEEQGVTEEEQPKKVKQGSAEVTEQPAEGDKEQTDPKAGGDQEDDAKVVAEMDSNESTPSEGQEKDNAETEAAEGPEEREESQSEEEGYLSEEEEEPSKAQQGSDRPSVTEDTVESDYMVMKPGVTGEDSAAAVGQSEMTPNLSYKEEEYQDQDLPLDFQDTFGFLDLLDSSASNPVNEFSVEPPGFEEEEEEEEDNKQYLAPPCPSWGHPDKDKYFLPNTNFTAHRPLPGKSHSLPYKSRPFQPVPSSSSDEDEYSEPDEDDDDDQSDKDEYEDMFCKSLPSARHFQGLNWTCSENDTSNSTDCSMDLHGNNQSECLHQTHSSQDLPSVIQLDTPTESEMIPSNGMDSLSPLPLDTLEHPSVEETNEDKSTKDVKEGGSEEDANICETVLSVFKEEERTDNEEDTYSQEPRRSMDSEDDEDTYFGPGSTSTTLEPSNIETSHTDGFLKEEPASSDCQQAGSTSCPDVAAIEMPSLDEPDLATGSVSVASQDTPEINGLSGEQEIQNDTQGQGGSSEVGDEQSGTREVVEEETVEIDQISALGVEEITENVLSEGEECKEDQMPVNEKVVEKVSEEVEEEAKLEAAEDLQEKKTEVLEGDDQTDLERIEEGMEKLTTKKRKEGRDRGEESDEQMEDDELEKETEPSTDSHLEELTEIKEGSVPEKRMAREMSKDEDHLSDDNCNSVESDFGVRLEEQQSKHENEQVNEDPKAERSTSGGEKPMRSSKNADIEGDLGRGVGGTVVISKHAPSRVYQVKAVPVVPPKPQHSKITAFKQQFQQRDADRQHPDRQVKNKDPVRQQDDDKDKDPGEAEKGDLTQNHDHQSTEQGTDQSTEQGADIEEQKLEENKADQEKPKLEDTSSGEMFLSLGWELRKGEDKDDKRERRGTWDGVSRRLEVQELDRETKRGSGISMCFDEAVARATGKRCREKEERFMDLQWEKGDHKEGSILRKKEEEGKID